MMKEEGGMMKTEGRRRKAAAEGSYKKSASTFDNRRLGIDHW